MHYQKNQLFHQPPQSGVRSLPGQRTQTHPLGQEVPHAQPIALQVFSGPGQVHRSELTLNPARQHESQHLLAAGPAQEDRRVRPFLSAVGGGLLQDKIFIAATQIHSPLAHDQLRISAGHRLRAELHQLLQLQGGDQSAVEQRPEVGASDQ